MFTVRPMERRDAVECTDIVNFIIRQGGTTAYEEEYSVEDFDAHYREEAEVCLVAETEGKVAGFQGMFDVGHGVLSIGSFADQSDPKRGVGRALIEGSIAEAKRREFKSIIAKITSDNASGLAYYSCMGFFDDHIIPNDHTRKDGTKVDRIVKRLTL